MGNDLRRAVDVADAPNFDFWVGSIRSRLETANHTSDRARYTLIFLSLVSAGFVMSTFSYFYSWNRHFVYEYLANPSVASQNIISEGIIKEWLSTQTYQLPILGIKIMTSDIQVFAPLVLLVASTWNYYEVRREHYTIGRLLGDVYLSLNEALARRSTKAIILGQEVYHGLIGHTVFNVIPYDKPISSLNEQLKSGNAIEALPLNMKLRRGVIKFLVLTPLASIVFVAITRILTFINIVSPVTGKPASLKVFGWNDSRTHLLILSFLLIFTSIYICITNAMRVFVLDNSTRALLDEYQTWAFEDGAKVNPPNEERHNANNVEPD